MKKLLLAIIFITFPFVTIADDTTSKKLPSCDSKEVHTLLPNAWVKAMTNKFILEEKPNISYKSVKDRVELTFSIMKIDFIDLTEIESSSLDGFENRICTAIITSKGVPQDDSKIKYQITFGLYKSGVNVQIIEL